MTILKAIIQEDLYKSHCKYNLVISIIFLLYWTIFPGMGVHFPFGLVIILVQEAILVIILVCFGYYPSTGGHFWLLS
jgi:hypothetical protein